MSFDTPLDFVDSNFLDDADDLSTMYVNWEDQIHRRG